MSELELNQDQTTRIKAYYAQDLNVAQISKKMRVKEGRIWDTLWRNKLPQQRIARNAA